MLIIVPTRGRPQSVQKVVDAWERTGAFGDGAALAFIVDADDPRVDDYHLAFSRSRAPIGAGMHTVDQWRPLVPKLNHWASIVARDPRITALGFAGDDHLPRTKGWARAYLAALDEMGTGIVYGDDGIQGRRLPTQWAMTADIVRTLGAMVPGRTEHLYCDNIVRDLGRDAGCLTYLPDVLIEHMHPVAGKAEVDAGYSHVNRPAQYAGDQRAYEEWKLFQKRSDVQKVKILRGVCDGE